MVRVTVHAARELAGPTTLTVAREERVLDACDEAGAPVAFSCRSASCGSCRVAVLAGAELLAPPRAEELATLASLGCEAEVRLACQLRVTAVSGEIQLQALLPT